MHHTLDMLTKGRWMHRLGCYRGRLYVMWGGTCLGVEVKHGARSTGHGEPVFVDTLQVGSMSSSHWTHCPILGAWAMDDVRRSTRRTCEVIDLTICIPYIVGLSRGLRAVNVFAFIQQTSGHFVQEVSVVRCLTCEKKIQSKMCQNTVKSMER